MIKRDAAVGLSNAENVSIEIKCPLSLWAMWVAGIQIAPHDYSKHSVSQKLPSTTFLFRSTELLTSTRLIFIDDVNNTSL